MKRVIISWVMVMTVVVLGMYFPFSGELDIMDMVMGFLAGFVGMTLGLWENKNI